MPWSRRSLRGPTVCSNANVTNGHRPLQGRIVLAQHRDIYDPETGGNYTIRRYAQEQRSGASRSRPPRSVRLLPLHPAYAPIILDNVPTGERHVIATFLAVLDTHV